MLLVADCDVKPAASSCTWATEAPWGWVAVIVVANLSALVKNACTMASSVAHMVTMKMPGKTHTTNPIVCTPLSRAAEGKPQDADASLLRGGPSPGSISLSCRRCVAGQRACVMLSCSTRPTRSRAMAVSTMRRRERASAKPSRSGWSTPVERLVANMLCDQHPAPPPVSPVTEVFWAGCMGTEVCVSDILTESVFGGPRSTTGLRSSPAAHCRSCAASDDLTPSSLHMRSCRYCIVSSGHNARHCAHLAPRSKVVNGAHARSSKRDRDAAVAPRQARYWCLVEQRVHLLTAIHRLLRVMSTCVGALLKATRMHLNAMGLGCHRRELGEELAAGNPHTDVQPRCREDVLLYAPRRLHAEGDGQVSSGGGCMQHKRLVNGCLRRWL